MTGVPVRGRPLYWQRAHLRIRLPGVRETLRGDRAGADDAGVPGLPRHESRACVVDVRRELQRPNRGAVRSRSVRDLWGPARSRRLLHELTRTAAQGRTEGPRCGRPDLSRGHSLDDQRAKLATTATAARVSADDRRCGRGRWTLISRRARSASCARTAW